MKKIFSLALLALLTVSAFGQEQQRQNNRFDLTPDQIAEIQTKKMVLHLDLPEKQQQQILEINKRNAIDRKRNMEEQKTLREKGQKPSSDEFANRINLRLDKQIAHQKEMKKILNEKQFESWKNSRKHQTHKINKRMSKRKKMQNHSKMQRKG